MASQLVPVGSYRTCAKPLSGLALIDPVARAVTSLMTTRTPFEVSANETFSRSPELMNRSLFGSGVKVVSVESTGLAGACDRPFMVMNAKFTYSMPTRLAQVEFWKVPLTGSSDRPKMAIAAHHLVGSQPLAPMATAQVGQGTHPGG